MTGTILRGRITHARLLLLAPMLVAFPACSGCGEEVPDDAKDAAPTQLGGVGDPCDEAADCVEGLVCAPESSSCQRPSSVPCTSHDQCGQGAYCTSEGNCAPAQAGGPCKTSSNCIAGEECRGNTCRVPGQVGSPCQRVTDCQAGLICDPATDACQSNLACTNHAACGAGAVCGTNGVCVPNVSGGPCSEDENCVLGESCVGDKCVEGCGGAFFQAERVAPNVMIVFDRSSSMNQDISGGSKWDIARAATNQLLANHGDEILFGLSLFPGPNSLACPGNRCDVSGSPNVPISPTSPPAISDYLEDASTCSLGTPIKEKLDTLRNFAGLMDPERPNYVLLLTDGEHNCSGDPTNSVSALRAQQPEIKTFVVGFGGEVDPQQLSAMAEAGGTARPTSPSYYQADDAASLNAAFAAIAGSVLSCDYTLSEVPPDPDLLFVYFNGQPVARNTAHTNGWDHEAAGNRLSFYGASCDLLRTGGVDQLTIVYGCPLLPGPDGGTGDGGIIPDPGSGDGGGRDAGSSDQDGSAITCSQCSECGSQACLIPDDASVGVCGPCSEDSDCCPGYVCSFGECRPQP